jgi:uncharacterized membrane protein
MRRVLIRSGPQAVPISAGRPDTFTDEVALYAWVLRYLTALVVLVALDAVWLNFVGISMFRPILGSMLLDSPRWPPAALFYLLYALGVVIFAVGPTLRAGSLRTALGYGASLGFFAYMTYELTNFATIRVWTAELAAIDIVWGTVLTALAAAASFAISSPAGRGK